MPNFSLWIAEQALEMASSLLTMGFDHGKNRMFGVLALCGFA